MPDIPLELLAKNLLEGKRYKLSSLGLSVAIYIGAIIFVDDFLGKFIDSIFTRLGIYFIGFTLILASRLYNRYYLPRNKKNRVGIVIALYTENNLEQQRLKNDFLLKLKKEFLRGLSDDFYFIVLPNHFSHKIYESSHEEKKIEEFNRTIKAHLYIWGSVKKRNDGDQVKYFLDFKGRVIHSPIEQNLSEEIGGDFGILLPQKINFLENESFKGFEIIADLTNLAIKYIVGVAAFVSGDVILAHKLHKDLKKEFDSIFNQYTRLKTIKIRISNMVSDQASYLAYRALRSGNVNDARELLKSSIKENQNNYGARLLLGYITFNIDDDIDLAMKIIHKAKSVSQGKYYEWQYSEIFLLFRQEKYQKGLAAIEKIKYRIETEDQLFIDSIIDSIELSLTQKGSKAQLHYWIGYIHYKRNNYPSALQNFEIFEKTATLEMNVFKSKTSSYLQEIKKLMLIS